MNRFAQHTRSLKEFASTTHDSCAERALGWILGLVVGGVLWALAVAASAATVSKGCPEGWNDPFLGSGSQICYFELRGEIVKGDADKLRSFLIDPKNAEHLAAGNLQLGSAGGDVAEALRIADILKTFYIKASVPVDTVCASSCFLIWAGAAARNVSKSGHVGLHRPYFAKETYQKSDGGTLASRQAGAMSVVRSYLQDQGVPHALIDTMMRRASNEIYWLAKPDYDAIGVYAPWYEEVLLAECGMEKDAAKRAFGALAADRSDPYAAWRKLAACESNMLTVRRSRAARSS